MRSTSVYHKVCKPLLASVFTNVFHLSLSGCECHNCIIISPVQPNKQCKQIYSRCITVFLPASTPATTIYHVCKVSLYTPLSVKTSTTLANHIFHKVHHVKPPMCVFLSLNCQLLRFFYYVLCQCYI